MSLRILVVGKGEGQELVSNEHSINFIKSARSDSGIVSLKDFNFVFQHLSPANPEASEAISRWREQGEASKVLGFSGGPVPSELSNLGISCIEGLAGRSSLLSLNWSAVPDDFTGTSYELVELLQAQPKETLLALSILCQGYLAVDANPDNEEPEIPASDPAYTSCDEALKAMGWSTFVTTQSPVKERLRPKVTRQELQKQVSDPAWWQHALDGEDLIKKVDVEWGSDKSKGWAEVEELLKRITHNQQITPKFVADAYLAIAQKLAGRPSH